MINLLMASGENRTSPLKTVCPGFSEDTIKFRSKSEQIIYRPYNKMFIARFDYVMPDSQSLGINAQAP